METLEKEKIFKRVEREEKTKIVWMLKYDKGNSF